MAFTLILGPMKSGKSLELIARVAPHEFAKHKVLYVQPVQNVRDQGICSRLGLSTASIAVGSLHDIATEFDVIGIDEIHMFGPADVRYLAGIIKAGKEVVASGLDLDYRGRMQPTIHLLMELKPDKLVLKLAVCDACNRYEAQFTQILHGDNLVLYGLPAIVPEDGTYDYQARCRTCFVQSN
jgi:thymidine kinase